MSATANVPRAPRILFVDDDRHLLQTVGDFLTFEGFEVTTATSAEEALLQIKRHVPDLMVLDIGMPGMGGLGLLRRLREERQGPLMPVLVLTARGMMESFIRGMDEVDGFLSKPCSGIDLANEIRAILARRESASTGKVRHVLVVEDSTTRARQISDSLLAAGYSVEVTRDGLEMFQRAMQRLPDVIMIKEFPVGFRGRDLALMVRGHSTTAGIPTVMYGAVPAEGKDRTEAIPAHITEVVHSPDTATLLAAVRRVLESNPQGAVATMESGA